jgi:hypothetical protein
LELPLVSIRLTIKGNCPFSTLKPPTIFPDWESSFGESFLRESSFLWECSLRESFLGEAFLGDSSVERESAADLEESGMFAVVEGPF